MVSPWQELPLSGLQEVVRLEQLSLSAWPALTTVFFDGWVVRFSQGYTKRANSVIPLYPSTQEMAEKVRYCRHLYNERGLPTIFKLTTISANAALDEYLSWRGFSQIDETIVQTCPLDGLKARSTGCLSVQARLSAQWLRGYFGCAELEDPKRQSTARALLAHIAEHVVAVRKLSKGRTIGCGFGVIQNRDVGLFDILVHKDFRRHGIGAEIVSAILEGARARGAATAYLQVIANNEAALRLYRKFGFAEGHRYCYRVKPPGSESEERA